jgi:protein-L-isoaspartate(D-aspartate) O-methyltransferase
MCFPRISPFAIRRPSGYPDRRRRDGADDDFPGVHLSMTIDFAEARAKMVDCQIRTMDVTQLGVLAAFSEVPREAFVPQHLKALAYIDDDLMIAPAAGGQPAEISKDDVVLEVGCVSGYGAAILSRLAGSVVAVETDPELAETAGATLSELGFDNVAVVQGDLAAGYAAEAPYDAIIFSGAVEVLPPAILEQLRDGGRLVVVEGVGNAARAKLYIREGENTSQRTVFNAAVKPLPGFARKAEFVF